MAAPDQPEVSDPVAQGTAENTADLRQLSLVKSILGTISEGILAVTPSGQPLFCNQVFRQQFDCPESELPQVEPGVVFTRIRSLIKDPQALWVLSEQVRSGKGDPWSGTLEFYDGRVYEINVRQLWSGTEHLGRVWLTRNISEQQKSQRALEVSESNLREVVREQERLIATIREIGTPVLPIYNRVLVLPLVGHIDTSRSAHLMDELLAAIQHHQASVVIIDITGVSLVDTAVANSLIQSTQAAALLGSHCVLVGISAAVARTIVQLGIDLAQAQVTTRRDLQAGIAYALHHLGYAITVIKEEPDWLAELDLGDGEAAAESPASGS